MSIELMKQALEALKRLNDIDGMYSWVGTKQALRQAIEEAEKQQALDKKADNARELGLDYEPDPVAYIDHVSGKPKFIDGYVVQTDYDIPLYTAPPQAEKQEPVAWMTNSEQDVTAEFLFSHVQTPMHNIPLYEAPRKEWVELNLDDIPDVFVGDISFCQGAKWAQTKLKEKNT
jgi:hypothetical protein